jgi:hypothetical protein
MRANPWLWMTRGIVLGDYGSVCGRGMRRSVLMAMAPLIVKVEVFQRGQTNRVVARIWMRLRVSGVLMSHGGNEWIWKRDQKAIAFESGYLPMTADLGCRISG